MYHMANAHDLTGKVFNKLTVLKRIGGVPSKYSRPRWLCLCECGREKVVQSKHLKSGNVKSCGCLLNKKSFPWAKKDLPYSIELSGLKFGDLEVVQFSGVRKEGYKIRRYWECSCVCGAVEEVRADFLRSGKKVRCLNCYHNSYKTIITSLLSNYKRRANKLKIDFTLSKEQFQHLLASKCHYCDSEPKGIITKGTTSLRYNGIDRVDNLVGYTENNSVAACWMCNRSKSSLSKKDFLDWIKRVAKVSL
jgi:hypothetical protein